jgi:hypothetical protein
MAEMNEMLNQAVEEADGLSAEVVRANETVDRLVKLAMSLGESAETGGAEAQRRLELLSARLAEAEAEVTQQNAAALVGLQGVLTVSRDVHEQVEGFLRSIRADLHDLKGEKERVRGDVERLGNAATGNIHRYSLQVRELEQSSDARLAAARERIGAFHEQVGGVRRDVAERRELLIASLRGFEMSARQRLDTLTETYENLALVVREQLADVQTTLRSLTDQLTTDINRRLGQDTLEALANSAEPLKDAMEEIEAFCKKSRNTSSDNFGEIVQRVDEVTKILDELRQPLDKARQYLR